jgi:hypothetical protein
MAHYYWSSVGLKVSRPQKSLDTTYFPYNTKVYPPSLWRAASSGHKVAIYRQTGDKSKFFNSPHPKS